MLYRMIKKILLLFDDSCVDDLSLRLLYRRHNLNQDCVQECAHEVIEQFSCKLG